MPNDKVILRAKRSKETLVLRTVYLPKSTDDKLRDIAFQDRVTKNDIIRCVVEHCIKNKLI